MAGGGFGGKGEIPEDRRGLMLEAYAMEIGEADCRSIFLDWMLGLPEGAGAAEIRAVLDRYGPTHPAHPMTAVLHEGLEATASPRRGRARRNRNEAG
jgi:hypothetical protein